MTLDEAIKLNEISSQGFPVTNAEKYYKALDLGNEALKMLERMKEFGLIPKDSLLLGETV